MNLSSYVFMIFTIAAGYILQNFPLNELVDWFVPEWILLVFIFWQLQAPSLVNFWWVWPLGMLLDVQQSTPLGSSVLGFAIVLYLLQLMYQRLRIFNIAQQMGVVFLLVCTYQLATYWAMLITDDVNKPLFLWMPAIMSTLVWPWLYLLMLNTYQKLR